MGGEFHEIFQLDDRYTGIALGDLHEKGIPGGLRAAIVNGALIAMSSVRGRRPGDMVRILNRAVSRHMKSDRTISLFYGVLDIDEMTFQFVNAGIAYPILVRGGVSRYLRFGQKNLQSSGEDLKKITLRLRNGDLLVILTDGILNVRNKAGRLMGLKKIMGMLENKRGDTDVIVDSLISFAADYSEGLERREDISIIAIKLEQAG